MNGSHGHSPHWGCYPRSILSLCSLYVGLGFQLSLQVVFHLTRSSASSSQLSVGRPVASMSLLQTFPKRSLGLPTGLDLSSSSPYKRSLGILPSSIRCTRPYLAYPSALSEEGVHRGNTCSFKLYCIVLYCIVLYCIVLYCIVLYCIVLYCIVLYCIIVLYTHQKSPFSKISGYVWTGS